MQFSVFAIGLDLPHVIISVTYKVYDKSDILSKINTIIIRIVFIPRCHKIEENIKTMNDKNFKKNSLLALI